jgi:hypothetical protein
VSSTAEYELVETSEEATGFLGRIRQRRRRRRESQQSQPIHKDLLVTDVGFPYFPKISPSHGLSDMFLAPELMGLEEGAEIIR